MCESSAEKLERWHQHFKSGFPTQPRHDDYSDYGCYRLHIYKQEELEGADMACIFQEDFSTFSEAEFLKMSSICRVNLRNLLRQRHVYVRSGLGVCTANALAMIVTNGYEAWPTEIPFDLEMEPLMTESQKARLRIEREDRRVREIFAGSNGSNPLVLHLLSSQKSYDENTAAMSTTTRKCTNDVNHDANEKDLNKVNVLLDPLSTTNAKFPLLRVKRFAYYRMPDVLHVRVQNRQRKMLCDQLNSLSLTTKTSEDDEQTHLRTCGGSVGLQQRAIRDGDAMSRAAGSVKTETKGEKMLKADDTESKCVVFRRLSEAHLKTAVGGVTGQKGANNGNGHQEVVGGRGDLQYEEKDRQGEGTGRVIIDVDKRHLKRSMFQLDEKELPMSRCGNTSSATDGNAIAPVVVDQHEDFNRGDIGNLYESDIFAATEQYEWQKMTSMYEQRATTDKAMTKAKTEEIVTGAGRDDEEKNDGAVAFLDAERIAKLYELLRSSLTWNDGDVGSGSNGGVSNYNKDTGRNKDNGVVVAHEHTGIRDGRVVDSCNESRNRDGQSDVLKRNHDTGHDNPNLKHAPIFMDSINGNSNRQRVSSSFFKALSRALLPDVPHSSVAMKSDMNNTHGRNAGSIDSMDKRSTGGDDRVYEIPHCSVVERDSNAGNMYGRNANSGRSDDSSATGHGHCYDIPHCSVIERGNSGVNNIHGGRTARSGDTGESTGRDDLCNDVPYCSTGIERGGNSLKMQELNTGEVRYGFGDVSLRRIVGGFSDSGSGSGSGGGGGIGIGNAGRSEMEASSVEYSDDEDGRYDDAHNEAEDNDDDDRDDDRDVEHEVEGVDDGDDDDDDDDDDGNDDAVEDNYDDYGADDYGADDYGADDYGADDYGDDDYGDDDYSYDDY